MKCWNGIVRFEISTLFYCRELAVTEACPQRWVNRVSSHTEIDLPQRSEICQRRIPGDGKTCFWNGEKGCCFHTVWTQPVWASSLRPSPKPPLGFFFSLSLCHTTVSPVLSSSLHFSSSLKLAWNGNSPIYFLNATIHSCIYNYYYYFFIIFSLTL